MKTININLIGDLGKVSKTNLKKVKKKSSLDTRTQILACILVIVVLVSFAASLGGWLLVKKMTSSLDRNLIKLNGDLDILKQQEAQLIEFRKNLKNEKQITEFKILVQKQLNNSFFPWSNVLKEIAVKLPKDIIVLKIEKSGDVGQVMPQQDSGKLNISGIIPSNKKLEPLTAISLFIFNLNEGQNSLLTKAKISKLDFDDKTKTYQFEIETSIRPLSELSSNNSTSTENKLKTPASL